MSVPHSSGNSTTQRPRVALFVTCLVDFFRPTVGFAAIRLLEEAGCEVLVPRLQTCCGQPAYNSGDRSGARLLAKNVLSTFEGFDFVVAPSGSCAGMIKRHYPELFKDDPNLHIRAELLAKKTFELTSFLVDQCGLSFLPASFAGTVTYHDSCSGLRELDVAAQPRKLLASVEGLVLREMRESDVCCGFGGTFCVKYTEISTKILEKKTENIIDSGAETLLAGDLGCLLNMAGQLKRKGSKVKVRHVAEVLAGMASGSAIGESGEDASWK